MKKIVLLLLTIYVLTGCKDSKPTIGLLMADSLQQRWLRDKDIFVDKVKALGGEIFVGFAGNDAEKQKQQAIKMIDDDGIKVLVIVPVNSVLAADIVKYAHTKKVKVIAYDRIIRDCDLDYYISFDNVQVGKMQAEGIVNLQPKGRYGVIGGSPKDYNSILLKLGQMVVLQPLIENKDIDLIYNEFSDDWSTQSGYDHTMELLKQNNDSVDAIIASNDALARGVIQALGERNLLHKVKVCGQDADLDNIKFIVQGLQTMTVYKPIKQIAERAAESAVNLCKLPDIETSTSINNTLKMVPTIILSNIQSVFKDNVEKIVISDGYWKKEQVFGK